MSNINFYIANSTGKLSFLTDEINSAFAEAKAIVEKELEADQIDAIFIPSQYPTAEMDGISGSSRGPNILYVYINPDHRDISKENLKLTLLHEIHHCMRQRKYPYGVNLGETIVYEGLATLYEEEHSGKKPIYAGAAIKESEIRLATKNLKNTKYDHGEWFFGTKKVTKWFGYTYGYKLCKAYLENTGKTPAELLLVDPKLVLA